MQTVQGLTSEVRLNGCEKVRSLIAKLYYARCALSIDGIAGRKPARPNLSDMSTSMKYGEQ